MEENRFNAILRYNDHRTSKIDGCNKGVNCMTAILGPHRGIASSEPREQFTADLLDRLWDVYRSRVAYVRTYEQVVRDAGATFVNDHIAFRTFAAQRPLTGIASLSRVFEAL